MPDYPRYIGRVLVNDAAEEAAEIERTTERTPNKFVTAAEMAETMRTIARKPRKPRAPKRG